jgi:hypothetical protein
MTVRDLMERMDVTEFREWAHFYSEDPWGELRADRRTALLAMQFYNAHRARNSPVGKLDDFMLYQPFKQIEGDDDAALRLITQAKAHNTRHRMMKQWQR